LRIKGKAQENTASKIEEWAGRWPAALGDSMEGSHVRKLPAGFLVNLDGASRAGAKRRVHPEISLCFRRRRKFVFLGTPIGGRYRPEGAAFPTKI